MEIIPDDPSSSFPLPYKVIDSPFRQNTTLKIDSKTSKGYYISLWNDYIMMIFIHFEFKLHKQSA